MDEPSTGHYIARTSMELLLILSALLSTLTGVVTGSLAPALHVQNCTHAADRACVVAVARVPRALGHRHLLGANDLRPAFAALPMLPAVSIAPPRLYLDRPRV